MLTGAALSFGLPVPQTATQTAPRREIETWYTYTVRGEHKGYAHEKLTPTPAGFNYLFQSDVYGVQTTSLDATLDMNYFVQEVTGKLSSMGAETSLTSAIDPEDTASLKLDVITPDRTPHPKSVPKSEVFYVNERVALYAMKQSREGLPIGEEKRSGQILIWDEGSAAVLQSMEFRFKGKAKRDYAGEETQLTLVTWDSLKGPVELYLDAYGRAVEEVNADRSQYLYASSDEAAKGKKTAMEDRNRRDPFRKDLAMGSEEPGGSGTSPTPKEPAGTLKPEEVAGALNKTKQLILEMQRLSKEKKREGLQKRYDEFMETYKQLIHAVREPKDRQKLAEAKVTADQLFPEGPERALQEVAEAAKRANEAFENGQCGEISAISDQVLRLLNDPRFIGSGLLSKAKEFRDQVRALQDRCPNRKRLNDKKLEITAVITYQEAQPYPLRFGIEIMGQVMDISETIFVTTPGAYAIINTGGTPKPGESPYKVVRIGEPIDSEITVKDIRPSLGNIPATVVFGYKEETRDVSMGKQTEKKK